MSGHRVAHDMAKAPLHQISKTAGETIVIDRYGQIVEIETGGAEARTLANPSRAGIRAFIRMKADGGDATMTASNGLNVAGNTTAVFADVGDMLEVLSVSHTSGFRWEILLNTGSVALS